MYRVVEDLKESDEATWKFTRFLFQNNAKAYAQDLRTKYKPIYNQKKTMFYEKVFYFSMHGAM